MDFLLRTDSPLLDLFAVRFALTEPGEQLGPPWRRVFHAPDAWVWGRPTALPPLFLPRSAPSRPAPTGWPRWRRRRTSPTRALCTAPAEADEGGGWARCRRRAGGRPTPTARPSASSRWARTGCGARALLAEPRLLATSIYQDGGWRVLAGGERRPALLTNGPLVGAWLPAGAYALELLYRPPGFLAGCLLAALGLAVGAAWWAAPAGRPAARRDGPRG